MKQKLYIKTKRTLLCVRCLAPERVEGSFVFDLY